VNATTATDENNSTLPPEAISLLDGSLFHYTSLSALACILQSKKIRFTRLDLVNDARDGVCDDYPSSRSLVFASCWTDTPYESVALWKLYTDFKGVRIELPTRMFEAEGWHVSNADWRSSLSSRLIFNNNAVHIKRSELRNVGMQLSDGRYFTRFGVLWPVSEVFGPSPMSYSGESFQIKERICNFLRLGLVKGSEWDFEREVRFRIFARPGRAEFSGNSPSIAGHTISVENWNGLNDLNESHEKLIQYLISAYGFISCPVESEYIDVPLDLKILSQMSLTLGPDASDGDDIIVRSLCSEFLDFAPSIRKSNLRLSRRR
jgi:hypothetical protein